MTQGEDSLNALDAQLAAIRKKTEAGLGTRADALEAAAERYRGGDLGALEEVRRTAHKIRGVATGQARLAALMEKVEVAAQRGELADISEAVREARAIAAAATPETTTADGPWKATGADSSASPRQMRRPRVLIVDDDEAILRMMRMSLERMAGFEVATAANSREAIEALSAQPFDVILLDAMMPGSSGLELCDRARDLETQAGAKIVILSAASPEQIEANAANVGPDAWWRKPLPPKEAIRRVRALLEAPRSRGRAS